MSWDSAPGQRQGSSKGWPDVPAPPLSWIQTSPRCQCALVFSIKRPTDILECQFMELFSAAYNLYEWGRKCFHRKENRWTKHVCLWPVVMALLFGVMDKSLVLVGQTLRKRSDSFSLGCTFQRGLFFFFFSFLKTDFVYGPNIPGSGQWAQNLREVLLCSSLLSLCTSRSSVPLKFLLKSIRWKSQACFSFFFF